MFYSLVHTLHAQMHTLAFVMSEKPGGNHFDNYLDIKWNIQRTCLRGYIVPVVSGEI